MIRGTSTLFLAQAQLLEVYGLFEGFFGSGEDAAKQEEKAPSPIPEGLPPGLLELLNSANARPTRIIHIRRGGKFMPGLIPQEISDPSPMERFGRHEFDRRMFSTGLRSISDAPRSSDLMEMLRMRQLLEQRQQQAEMASLLGALNGDTSPGSSDGPPPMRMIRIRRFGGADSAPPVLGGGIMPPGLMGGFGGPILRLKRFQSSEPVDAEKELEKKANAIDAETQLAKGGDTESNSTASTKADSSDEEEEGGKLHVVRMQRTTIVRQTPYGRQTIQIMRAIPDGVDTKDFNSDEAMQALLGSIFRHLPEALEPKMLDDLMSPSTLGINHKHTESSDEKPQLLFLGINRAPEAHLREMYEKEGYNCTSKSYDSVKEFLDSDGGFDVKFNKIVELGVLNQILHEDHAEDEKNEDLMKAGPTAYHVKQFWKKLEGWLKEHDATIGAGHDSHVVSLNNFDPAIRDQASMSDDPDVNFEQVSEKNDQEHGLTRTVYKRVRTEL